MFSRYRDRRDEIVKEILKIYPLVAAGSQSKDATAAKPPGDGDAEGTSAKIFMISLNRPVTSALEKSVPAVKADAARTLFDVKCNKIVWAVLDFGIDASHTAFVDRASKTGAPRVQKTFDFAHIRDIVSSDNNGLSKDDLKDLLDQIEAQVGLDRNKAYDRLQKIAADAADSGRPIGTTSKS